jgi:NTP pyrophosphatase (non-canonical NTP hydrolase)
MSPNNKSTRQVTKIKKSQAKAINEITQHVYGVASESGFHENDEGLLEGGGRFAELCANLHGEISELFEAYRKGNLLKQCDKPINLSCAAEELADVCIRAMDTAQTLGIDLGQAIIVKDSYNQTRPYKHGNKLA